MEREIPNHLGKTKMNPMAKQLANYLLEYYGEEPGRNNTVEGALETTLRLLDELKSRRSEMDIQDKVIKDLRNGATAIEVTIDRSRIFKRSQTGKAIKLIAMRIKGDI